MAPPKPVAAQVPGLAEGDTVRYFTAVDFTLDRPPNIRMYPRWRTGVVIGLTPDTLVVRLLRLGGAVHVVPLDSMHRLDVSQGRLPRIANIPRRASAGFFLGIVVGAGLQLILETEGGPFRAMGIGGLAGAGAGIIWSGITPGPRRWVELPLPRVN